MKRMKRTLAVLVVVMLLVSGAVTVYAVSAETGKDRLPATAAPAAGKVPPAEYAAEEMAVEEYYQNWELSEDGEMV